MFSREILISATKGMNLTETELHRAVDFERLISGKGGSHFLLVNQTRPDQTRPDQTRLQSLGPNSRTCVLVTRLGGGGRPKGTMSPFLPVFIAGLP